MAVTGTLAKLKNYFMGWHDQEYDYLHKSTSDIATETNPNKTATTQAIKDYVASQQYDDTDVLNQISGINNKLGTTSTLPTPNNITTSINTLNSTINVLNRAASTTQNGYIKASDYKKLMNASYTTSYTNNEKTMYWKRFGRWAILHIRGVPFSGKQPDKIYTLSSNASSNSLLRPAVTSYGSFSYDELKWIRITDNDGKGWAVQYKPLVSKATIYASIVFPCYNQPY